MFNSFYFVVGLIRSGTKMKQLLRINDIIINARTFNFIIFSSAKSNSHQGTGNELSFQMHCGEYGLRSAPDNSYAFRVCPSFLCQLFDE